MRGARDGPIATGSSSTQPAVQDDRPRNSRPMTRPDITGPSSSITQPTIRSDSPDSSGATSAPNSGLYQNILIKCNALIKEYRKGKVSKATAYVEIQSKLVRALRDDRARTDAPFKSFIATIESHDSEVKMAARRAAANAQQRSTSAPIMDVDERQSDAEPSPKRTKFDESAYAWVAGRKEKNIILSEGLTKTLKLIDTYTIDIKAAKWSLTALSSWTWSGKTSFQEEQSTLMQFSADNSPPPMMTSRSRSLETSRSLLEQLNLPSTSRMEEIGPLPKQNHQGYSLCLPPPAARTHKLWRIHPQLICGHSPHCPWTSHCL